MRRIGLIPLCTVAFVLGMLFDGLITRVPKESLTVSRLQVLKRDVETYYAQHKTLPKTIEELSRFSSRSESELKNSWGKPIYYRTTNHTEVILTTVGYGDVEFMKRFSVK